MLPFTGRLFQYEDDTFIYFTVGAKRSKLDFIVAVHNVGVALQFDETSVLAMDPVFGLRRLTTTRLQ